MSGQGREPQGQAPQGQPGDAPPWPFPLLRLGCQVDGQQGQGHPGLPFKDSHLHFGVGRQVGSIGVHDAADQTGQPAAVERLDQQVDE